MGTPQTETNARAPDLFSASRFGRLNPDLSFTASAYACRAAQSFQFGSARHVGSTGVGGCGGTDPIAPGALDNCRTASEHQVRCVVGGCGASDASLKACSPLTVQASKQAVTTRTMLS